MNAPTTHESSSHHPPVDRSFVIYALAALAIALIVRFFIAAPYIVNGASMDPTLDTWDYLITDRVSYHFHAPERGDVIVFRPPERNSRTFIKRVIGLPGETVIVRDGAVMIMNDAHPDGFTLDEPYIAEKNIGGIDNVRTTLDEESYFVLGDNRRVSADSRSWGALPEENIVGRAIVRLFPFDQITLLPGQTRYENEQ